MARQAVMKVLHNVDPDYLPDLEREIIEALGNYDMELWGQECLVAPFHQQPIRKSGLIIAGGESTYDDKWQSKSFMVLRLGDGVLPFCEKNKKPVPEIGKWYFGYPLEHDHLSIQGEGSKKRPPISGMPYREFSGWPCRLVLISDIRGRTGRPWEIM